MKKSKLERIREELGSNAQIGFWRERELPGRMREMPAHDFYVTPRVAVYSPAELQAFLDQVGSAFPWKNEDSFAKCSVQRDDLVLGRLLYSEKIGSHKIISVYRLHGKTSTFAQSSLEYYRCFSIRPFPSRACLDDIFYGDNPERHWIPLAEIEKYRSGLSRRDEVRG